MPHAIHYNSLSTECWVHSSIAALCVRCRSALCDRQRLAKRRHELANPARASGGVGDALPTHSCGREAACCARAVTMRPAQPLVRLPAYAERRGTALLAIRSVSRRSLRHLALRPTGCRRGRGGAAASLNGGEQTHAMSVLARSQDLDNVSLLFARSYFLPHAYSLLTSPSSSTALCIAPQMRCFVVFDERVPPSSDRFTGDAVPNVQRLTDAWR